MMVDRLKKALDELESPVCPTCRIEMTWTRSSLAATDTIVHLFHCPHCWRAGETSSKIEVTAVLPDKLSKPAFMHAA